METIQKISHLEHILKRPDSYVGPTAHTNELYWILEGNKFVQKNIDYSPALLKIFYKNSNFDLYTTTFWWSTTIKRYWGYI